ncbi:MAG: lytic transglycosylase domain-containing protein [Pseudomonadota bacterium]
MQTFIRRPGWASPLLAVLLCCATLLRADPITPNRDMTAAFEAAEINDWVQAFRFAERVGDPLALDLILWTRLREGQGDWWEYPDFLRKHPDWPGLARLRKAGEADMPEGLRASDVQAFFANDAPQTGTGALRLGAALQAGGDLPAAQEVIRTAWRDLSLTEEEHDAFVAEWPRTLRGHHEVRLDNLLWDGRGREAERMLPLVGADWRALARARIALRANQRDGVNALIDAVPAGLQADPGLAYERFVWRARRGFDSAKTLLMERSTSAASLGRPEKWGTRRRGMARQEMRNGNYRTAYRIAANHHMTEGYPPADMDWLAGYIQLRKLNNPGGALPHFEAFRARIDTPISLGRAGYWLGRTHEALGNSTAARDAYALAATYQTSFYGQLAAARAGFPVDASLANPQTTDWQRAGFADDPLLRAARIAWSGGDWVTAELFLSRIALDLQNPGELRHLAQMALEAGRADTAVRLAKRAARRGDVYPETAYPLTEITEFAGRLPVELVTSLARQESELNPEAISRVGARGLMQVMPATAQDIARDMGLPYSRARLTEDWRYNVTLGTHYLEGLMDEFRGSVVLSAAGYNAGPGRPRQWITRYGDPRRMNVDRVVDWIEGIPFRETRNYVMRVVEGMHVYRMRISGRAIPLQIEEDLTAG